MWRYICMNSARRDLFSLRALTFSFLRELEKKSVSSCKFFIPDSLISNFNNNVRVLFVCIVGAFSACLHVCVELCATYKHIYDLFPLSALQRLQLSCMTEHTQCNCLGDLQ